MKRKLSRKRSGIARQNRATRSAKNKLVAPKTVEQFFAMSEKHQDLWENVDQAITEMRAGASRTKASRKFHLDPRKLSELARPALRKLKNGRWAAKKYDRLLRVLALPSRKGLIDIGVPDSGQATLVGKYWNAIDLYRGTGDASSLHFFGGEFIIDADGRPVPFMTDTDELDRLESAGQLSFESLYSRVA